MLISEVLEHLVTVLQCKRTLWCPSRQEFLTVSACVLEAFQAVEHLDQRKVRGLLHPLLYGVHDLRGRRAQLRDALEGPAAGAQHRCQLAQDHLPDRAGHGLGLEVRYEAEVGQGCYQLVVERVAARKVPQAEQGLEAVQQAALPAEDLVRQDVRGRLQVAMQDKRLHELARLFHGVLLQELQPVWVVVHLLGFPPWACGRLRRLVSPGLLCLALLLMFQLLLLRGAHVCLPIACTRSACCRRLPAGLPIVELQVDADGILCSTSEELVGVEALLHAEHGHIGLQGSLPEAVVMEVKLVLGNVIEVLEGLAVHLQGLSEVLLAAIAAPHGRLVCHALHVMKVCGPRRVRLFREHEGLLHACLGVVHSEEGTDALRVEEAVGQVHLPHLVKPLGRLVEVSSVAVDAGFASVYLDECRRVLHGTVGKVERPLGVTHKVKVVGGDHEGKEQARGWLLISHVARSGVAILLAHWRSKP
mmetsp:Transcript_30404/g.83777  ORF Transcript_30404/g.83777 Transcript_30404/m.83777 type:complete len:474 (+) Transcript_30404:471-1892(+)